MKTIDKNELFENFKSFLKDKGVELHDGSYTRRMEQGCGLLADTINLSQKAFEKTCEQVDKGWDQMRQFIHESTAPKTPPAQAASEPCPGQAKAKSKTGSKKKAARPSRKK